MCIVQPGSATVKTNGGDAVPGDDARVALLADDRIGHRHRHLDAAVARARPWRAPVETVAVDAHGPARRRCR